MKLLRRSGPKPLSISERLYRRFLLKYHARYLITDLQLRAKSQSLDYVEAHMRDAMILRDRWSLLQFAAQQAPTQGLMLECGVADGVSLSYLASRIARDWHGFDSFEGLPEHWSGTEAGKGTFGQGGVLPNVPTNVTLHKGWFEETLPRFLAGLPGEGVAFLHVDCDIYSATATVFKHLGPRLGSGAVLVFDEYFNYWNWQRHEWRAFQEFVRDTGTSYRYLGFAQKNGHVAVKLGEKSEAASREAVEKLKMMGK